MTTSEPARSRPIQFGPFTLWTTTMPRSLTILYDAARRQRLHSQGILEMRESGADDQNGLNATSSIFNPPREVDHPLSGRTSNVHFTDRKKLPGQDRAKIRTIADVRALVYAPGASNVVAGKRKQGDAADKVR